MGKKSAPAPPDPRTVSAAQTGTNVSTGVANAFLQNFNEVGPEGSKTFDVTGSYDWTDPYTDTDYNIPRFTSTTELGPVAQETFDTGLRAERNLASLAESQSAALNPYMADRVDLSNEAIAGRGVPGLELGNEATEGRLFELGRKRLDPVFAEDEATMKQQLADQGIQADSSAYSRATRDFGQRKNDAYNQLALTGRAQSANEAIAEHEAGMGTRQQSLSEIMAGRNQPINEISALMSGSQVAQPNFAPSNIGGIPTTDNAGIIQANYQNQLAAKQMDNKRYSDLYGGMFKLGSSALTAGATAGWF